MLQFFYDINFFLIFLGFSDSMTFVFEALLPTTIKNKIHELELCSFDSQLLERKGFILSLRTKVHIKLYEQIFGEK